MEDFEDKIDEDEELSGEMEYEDDPQEDVEALQRELQEAEAIFVSESNSPTTRISAATTEGNGMIQSAIQPRLPQSILAQRDTSGRSSSQPRMSSSVKTVVISDDIEEADLTFITAEDNSTLAGNTDSIITDGATIGGESETTNPRPPRSSSTLSNNRTASASRRAGRSSKRPRRSRSTATSSSNARNAASTEESGRRRSHLCCGFFCDLRRACLIVDIVYFCLTALGLIILFRESSYFNLYNSSLSDGGNDNNKPGLSYTVSMIKTMCGMCFGLMGIIGATTFHPWLVFATFVWMAIDVISSLFFKEWPTVVFVSLFAYPQFALFLALQSGNLGRDNYSTEKYCFLCPGR